MNKQTEQINIGDQVIMKKGHPCGTNQWKVVRWGADVKLECCGCGRIVLLERPKFYKYLKKKVCKNEEK